MGIEEFQGGSGRIVVPDLRLLSSLDSGSCLQLLSSISQPIKNSCDSMGTASEGINQLQCNHRQQHYLFASVDPPKANRLIREKLKGKRVDDEPRRGPLVARHPSLVEANNNASLASYSKEVYQINSNDTKHAFRTRTSRTPSPSILRGGESPLLSPSDRVGLQRSRSNVGINSSRRRRSPSTPRSRPGSPSSVRGISPAGSFDNLYIEAVHKRVQIAMRARLYLLQQQGPHSFVVGGDSPENKFKIMIGPQTCTCGRGPHCLHVLFVMLRVFQISESDPLLLCKQLKNFEVESLFSRYKQQRSSRIKASDSAKRKPTAAIDDSGIEHIVYEGMDVNKMDGTKSSSQLHSLTNCNDEGEKCVICLLEMIDCESLVDCSNGCHNKYHLHCFSIWAEHCRLQQMQPFCPLCRILWNGLTETTSSVPQVEPLSNHILPQSSIESLTCASSELLQLSSIVSVPGFRTFQLLQHQQQNGQAPSASSSHQRNIGHSKIALPRCHSVVPKEFTRLASNCADVFGQDLVACMFSRDWKMKMLALRRLNQEVLDDLGGSMATGGNLSDGYVENVVRVCCQIINFMCSNPVYKVYLTCMQCLKTLLAYVAVKTEENLRTLQDLVKPIVLTILLRCCDGTKPGELSVDTLIELCKGQTGELAVGRQTSYPSECGIGGVGYVLRCLLDGMSDGEPRSWQWLLGRLNVVQKLMLEFPQDFHLVLVRNNRDNTSCDDPQPLLPIASRYERLVTVWRFALATLSVQHVNVVKQAREVIMTSVRFAATVPAVTQQILVLASTDPLLEQRIMTWVRVELKSYVENLWTDTEMSFTEGSSALSRNRLPCKQQQPHLPSCGGISPSKELDHNYIAGKLSSVCGANQPFLSPVPSPCPSATSSPGTVRRRLPAWNASCNASSKVFSSPGLQQQNQQQQQQLHSAQGRQDARNVIRGQSRRPNYLPLQGTFRDVLEWEKCNKTTTSPTRATIKHRSPPPRIDRNNTNCQQANIFRRSLSTGGAGSATAQVGVHDKSPRSPRDVAAMPTIKSQRRASDVTRPCSTRLCSKRLDGMLGPILPSICKGPQTTSKATRPNEFQSSMICPLPSSLFATKAQPPPVPPCSPEGAAVSLDNKLCKLKQHAELEEAVAVASAMVNSVYQTDIPDIPGLMQYNDEQEFIIHEEPDNLDEESSSYESYASYSYVENVHWQKGSILGTGAFSTCYQVRDMRTGTLMAMKQVSFCRNSPDEQDKVMYSIKEEIALMARLNHPHIVRIMGATRQRNHFNMFVEWMPGGSVSNLLDKYGAFTEPVIINYTQQVLSGLAYLHDHQVLHRDLKGANLLVDSTGHHLRIGDFGAAARLASRTTIAGEFQGQLLGTIAFMAPEVLRGDDYGRSCDIWSVGCVLIEMATTKPPWNANDVSNHLALIYKIARARDPPPVPERLSPATRDLALRCLEIKCDDRPPAKELLKHPVFQLNF